MLRARCDSIRRSFRRSMSKSSTPDSAKRLVTALSFSTRVCDALNNKSAMSSWLVPADEDSLGNSCCEFKNLARDNMEEDGGFASCENDNDESGETLVDNDECFDGETSVLFRRVDEDFLSRLDRRRKDPAAAELTCTDPLKMVLSGNVPNCPTYIKMDGYIAEDLQRARQQAADVARLLSPTAHRVRRAELRRLLPSLPRHFNLSAFLSPAPPLPPRLPAWQRLLAAWTDPASPPPHLKSLLRSGCPPQLRAHAWNLLLRRRRRHRPLLYTAGLATAEHSKPKATRVVASLRRCLPIPDASAALRMATALLPVFNDDEEATFSALVAWTEAQRPLVDGEVVWRLVEAFLPALAGALTRRFGGRAARMVADGTGKWRETGMIGCFPEEVVWRLWDAWLGEGVAALFRFQVAVVARLRGLLEGVETMQEAEAVIRMAGRLVQDVEHVMRIGKQELKGLTRKVVEKMRKRVEEEMERRK